MRYRPDVDGLRAVAVTSVVLYHVGLPITPGGFVGVDVFFVISGYLITKLITDEIDANRFSLAKFYERRARRILPALFAMMAITAAVATTLLIPTYLEDYARSAATAAISVSNIYFWRETGYFGLGAHFVPLLHTWSLGVEEQFYLAVPLYLVISRQLLRWSWPTLILPVVIVSFAISVWLVRQSPNAAFYLPFGRMWELGIGSLLAVGFLRLSESNFVNNIVGLAGFGAILSAVLTYRSTMVFPGESALLPCIGACLLIYANAGERTVVSKLLSARPVVFVGLISYSLYLWHWPLFVFARIVLGRELSVLDAPALLTLSIGLAILSWRYIEQPFRRGAIESQAGVFRASAMAVAACLVFGFAVSGLHGLPSRFRDDVRVLATADLDINPMRAACDSPSIERIRRGDLCVIGAKGRPATIALVGDSFGDALMPGLDVAASEHGASVIVMTHAGCRPLLGISKKNPLCERGIEAVTQKIASSPEITKVIVIGRWSTMVEGTRFGAVTTEAAYMEDEETRQAGYEEGKRVFWRAVQRTIHAFGEGKLVYWVAFLPEQETLVPQDAAVRAVLGQEPPSGVSRAKFETRQRAVRALLADTSLPDFDLIDASTVLCNADGCPAIADGRALYFDDNHLSRTGAIRAHHIFDAVFLP